LENIPSLQAIVANDHVMAPTAKGVLEYHTYYTIIISN
jgi:hypothetical protein